MMKKLLLLSTLYFVLSTFSFLLSPAFAQTYQQADSLRQVYMEKQSYDTALVYAEQAADLVKEEFGEMDTLYADMLNEIENVYFYIGDYNKVLQYGFKEKEIRENLKQIDHPDYGTCLNNLGMAYLNLGQYQTALPYSLDALNNTEKTLGKNHSWYGIRLANLARLYLNMGQYDKSMNKYLEALDNFEKTLGKLDYSYGICLSSIAVLYSRIGQHQQSLNYYLESLEILKETVGTNHSEYAKTLNNLANLYKSIGEIDKAMEFSLNSLSIIEKIFGKNHVEYGIHLGILANLYRDLGQYQKALPMHEEVLEIHEKTLGKEHFYYGIGLNNLATTLEYLDQNDRALLLYEEALLNTENSVGKQHPTYGSRLTNLANLYRKVKLFDVALPLYNKAIENCEKSLGKNHPEYGTRLGNLAELFWDMNQYDTAIKLCKDVIDIHRTTLGKNHPYYGISSFNLAITYYKLEKYDDAIVVFNESIKNNFHNINRAFSFLSESEKEKFIMKLSWYFNNYKSFFMDYAPENPKVASDAYNIELATKGMILQSGIQMREAIQQSGDSAALAKYDQWQVLRLTIANQYSQPIEKRLPNLPEMEAEAEALEGELARISSAFAESQKLGAIKWQDIQQVLNPNEACVEFSSFKYIKAGETTDSIMYVALVLLPNSEYPILVPLCEQKQLDSILYSTTSSPGSLNRMYRSIEMPAKNQIDYGKRIYELIWEPIADIIPEDYTVYYAPSGSFHKIAFAAIPVNEKECLSDNYKLMQVSSTSVLLEQSKFDDNDKWTVAMFGGIRYQADTSQLLAVATNISSDANYVSRSVSSDSVRGNTNWTYLPGTLKEVQNIASIAENNSIDYSLYTEDLAIEEQYKSLQGKNSPRIIHIATHGFFFPDAEQTGNNYNAAKNPLNRAGLLFAGGANSWNGASIPAGLEDGILTAYEATNVILGNTQLVVLSACETGLGEIRGSEGVFGLQRAFKNAGAEYIIMSLWKVPDAETAEFMEYFYTELFGGETIPEAFRNTQNYMKLKYPEEPYNWAAFVLVR